MINNGCDSREGSELGIGPLNVFRFQTLYDEVSMELNTLASNMDTLRELMEELMMFDITEAATRRAIHLCESTITRLEYSFLHTRAITLGRYILFSPHVHLVIPYFNEYEQDSIEESLDVIADKFRDLKLIIDTSSVRGAE